MKKFLLSLIAIVTTIFSANAAWEKTTSIAVGDVVVLAFDNATVAKELSSVTTAKTPIGAVEDYATAPEGLYPLTVVAGSQEGTFAFETSDGTYLSWSSGNSLTTNNEVADASSWTVSFTEAGAADIYNVGTTARKLQYNTNSPRFACYGNSGQQAPYLWKKVADGSVAKPTFSPASTSFAVSIEVTITGEEGTAIYYTMDGTDPTTESAVYSEALVLTETTTVKAIAVKDDVASNVAEATYTALTKSTIVEAQAAENGTTIYVEGTIVASAANGAVLYDGTDYLYYYNNANSLAIGQIVRMVGALGSYGGAKQLTNSTIVTVLGEEEVVYPTATALKGADLDAIKDNGISERKLVSFIGTLSIEGNYYNLAVEGAETAIASIVKPVEDLSELNKQTVKVTGYPVYVNKSYVYVVATEIAEQATELTNASFEADEETNSIGIRTYNKDIKGEEVAQAQSVTGWDIVENGDARAAGVFAYGSESFLGGEGYWVPQISFDTDETKALGVVAVWSATIQYTQSVYLTPGKYLLQVPVYNAGGTTAFDSNLIGAAGIYSETKTYPVGKWTVENVEFTIEEAQEVTISLGYKAANSGSGAMPHLFLENATLFSGEEDIVAAKEAAETQCAAANAAIALAKTKEEARAHIATLVAGDALFCYPAEAILAAQEGVETAATVEDVATALATLDAAINAPVANQAYIIANNTAEGNLSVNDNNVTIEAGSQVYFTAVEGGYAISNAEGKYIFKTEGNTWTLATTENIDEAYVLTVNVVEGGYTLQGANGLLGTDNAAAGSVVYANKAAANNGIWNIAVIEAPEVEDVTALIKNPAYLENGYEGWTYTENGFKSRNYDAPMNLVTYSGNCAFEVNQTLENVPAGLYKLTLNAFYRAGSRDDEKGYIDRQEELPKFLTMYADVQAEGNKYSKKVMNLSEGAKDTQVEGNGVEFNGKFIPDGAADSRVWYIAGEYQNEVLFNVFENGASVTIGVSKEVGLPSDYCPIGAWKLYRLGDADADQATPDAKEEEPEPQPELQPGDDATAYITNPSFETGDATGWNVINSSDTGVKPNSNSTYTTEGIDGDYLFNTWWQGTPITQTVTGLPNGLYELKALMTNDAITAGNKPCLYLLANGEHSAAFSAPSAGVFAEGSMQFYVTDGTATIGAVGGNADGSFVEAGYYWYKVDNFRLTYLEALPDIADIEIPEGKMSAAAAEAIATAKENSDVLALLEAVKVAKESIAAYAAANASIEAANALMESTNVYTAEALATYKAIYDEAKAKYDEGTLADADAKALENPALVTGWHHDPAKLADDLLLSAWAINDVDAKDFETSLYINTWSIEGETDGSEFKVPFYEYWTNDDQSLGENKLTATMNGLSEGLYEVSAWVRVRAKNGYTAPAYGITLDVNNDEAVNAAAGEQVGESQFFLAEFKAYGRVAEDGVLKINLNVATDNNISWLSFKNVKFEAKDETELAYQQALASIEDGGTYHMFYENEAGTKFYLNSTGYLVADSKKAATFTFNAVNADGTLYKTGWNLGCKFTNPSLTNGPTGDVVQNGHLNVGANNRDNWERQVLFLKNGKYAVRATNANSANWGANTYWTVTNAEAELPNADYSLDMSYVWQIEEFVDNRPEALAKIQTWAAKLVNTWSSNAKESTEGSYEALTDNDYTTFFHSQWSGTGPDADHYLQAEMLEASDNIYFYFKKRSQNNNNRPTQIHISASNDGENFTDITSITEGLPTAATAIDYTSENINLGQAYKYIRFSVPTTNSGAANNGHVFFTFSELHIYSSWVENYGRVTDYTDLDDSDIERINAIDEQINVAYQNYLDKQAILDTKAAVLAAIERIKAYAENVEGEEEAKTTLTTTLDAIDTDAITSLTEAQTALQAVKVASADFVGSLNNAADRDVTAAFIANATPTASIDGWEGDKSNAFDTGNNVAEYWNMSGAGFRQSVTLPAGSYKLSVVALTRTDMTGTVYAGENSTNIVTVESDVVNNRTQANTWFNEGNGVNEVEFTLSETTDVEIGLKADVATGDHWTVWRSFNLVLLGQGEEPVEPVDYTDYIVNADLTGTDGWDTTNTKGLDGSGIVKVSTGTTFDFKQTIANLPAGQYKMTAQAAYRFTGSEADEYAAIQAGTKTKYATLYAGTVSTEVQNRWDGASDTDYAGGNGSVQVEGKYVPNSSNAVKAWFAAGQYINEVVFNHPVDGDVAIGIVKSEAPAEGDYTVLGPWKLYRIGDAQEEPEITYAITIAETENGKVEADKAVAAEGETVTVTVTPDEGYKVDEAYWSYGETKNNFEEPEDGGNAATFVMPAADVTVTITFKPEEEETPDYVFVASEWPAGDPGRISADNVVVNAEANTITVDKAGDNNVALLFKGRDYKVAADMRYFVIKGTGLSIEDGKAYLWWLNNRNNGSQIAPTSIYQEDGATVFAWDVLQSGIAGTLGTEETIFSNSSDWSTTFGLTLADEAVPAVISYIGFQNEIPEVVQEAEYTFVASEWGAGDAGRISSENVIADDEANTITVNQTGDNNVALLFKSDNLYYVENIEYFVIKGTGISTEEGKALLWWLNGKNDGGASYAPTYTKTETDGTVTLLWKLDECGNIGENLNATGKSYLAGKDGWNTTFGLTLADETVPAVISYIGYEKADSEVVTGINAVNVSAQPNAIYDLSGRRVSKAQKGGIYIINGKKVAVK